MSTRPRRIYLDHNATTPLRPEARAAIAGALDELGEVGEAGEGRHSAANPSSTHAEGRRARALIEGARAPVAALLGRGRDEIVFTSGGTEANWLGVLGLAASVERVGGPRTIITTRIEHPSLVGAAEALAGRGWRVLHLPVSADGALGLDPALAEGGIGVLALAAVNHELGTLAPLDTLVPWARAAGARIHVDAVQAAGKLALGDLGAAGGVDALAISGHKLGGPPGVGALAIAAGVDALPLWPGGHQERGRRPGTENLLGVVGLGAAAAAADPRRWPAIAALGAALEAGLSALPDVRIHGAGEPRIGGTVNAGFTGARGESVVAALDLAGIAAATGAACTSGAPRPSAVLRALGQPDERAGEAVRFSLGRGTTEDEIHAVLAALPAILARARRYR